MGKFDTYKNKKIYISGPMTGYENHNSDAFYKTETYLRSRGFSLIENPIHLQEFFGDDHDYNFYFKRALQRLLDSDAVYVFGDYNKSFGVKKEIEVALLVGMPVFYEEFND